MTIDEVLNLLASECGKSDSRTGWARANGLSPSYVGDVLARRRDPGKGILQALGLRRVVTYEKMERR
jgi:hypothetical protein